MKSEIEIIKPLPDGIDIHHALFDFDGTLSLIREGWQQIMIPMMVDFIMQTPNHEDEAEVQRIVKEYVTRLTGKQTIFQMIQLAEEVEKRGGKALDPREYKEIYHQKLLERIHDRLEGLRNGTFQPEEYLVPGSFSMLQALKARNVKCYLA
ncbi:MAG TPA: HAD family hydrolase, partial [Flexilinea sp.]|nr:HAD family hydrolase [Flexilinea sp.]